MLKSIMICCLLMAALAIANAAVETPGRDGGPARWCTHAGELIPDVNKNRCNTFYECTSRNEPVQMQCPAGTCFYDGDTYCDWIRS